MNNYIHKMKINTVQPTNIDTKLDEIELTDKSVLMSKTHHWIILNRKIQTLLLKQSSFLRY